MEQARLDFNRIRFVCKAKPKGRKSRAKATPKKAFSEANCKISARNYDSASKSKGKSGRQHVLGRGPEAHLGVVVGDPITEFTIALAGSTTEVLAIARCRDTDLPSLAQYIGGGVVIRKRNVCRYSKNELKDGKGHRLSVEFWMPEHGFVSHDMHEERAVLCEISGVPIVYYPDYKIVPEAVSPVEAAVNAVIDEIEKAKEYA